MGGKILPEVPLALDVVDGVVELHRDWGRQVASIRTEFHRLLTSPFFLFESTGVVSTNLKMLPTRVIFCPGCVYGHELLLHIAGAILMMDNA